MSAQPDSSDRRRAGLWFLAGLLIAVAALSLMTADVSIWIMLAALPIALVGMLLMFVGMARVHAEQIHHNLQAKAEVQQALDPQQPSEPLTRLEKMSGSPRGCLVLWLAVALATPFLFLVLGLLLLGMSRLFSGISGVPDNLAQWTAALFLALLIGLIAVFIRQSAARLGFRPPAKLPTLAEDARKIGRLPLRFLLFAGLFGAGFWLYRQALSFILDHFPRILYLPTAMLAALVIFMGPLIGVAILPVFWLRRPLTDGDYDEVLRRLKVIGRIPMMAPLAMLYKSLNAGVLLQAGRYAEAEAVVHQQMDEVKKADFDGTLQYDSLTTLGLAAMEQGRMDEAETDLEAAIRSRPTRHSAYLYLSEWCLRQEGQAARALDLLAQALSHHKPSWLVRAIDGNEDRALIHMQRACALAQLGNDQEADAALEQALLTFTRKPGTELAGLLYWAGETRRAQGRKEAAVEQFQQAVALDPRGRTGELSRKALAELQVQE